jgi:hypothetical protein
MHECARRLATLLDYGAVTKQISDTGAHIPVVLSETQGLVSPMFSP